MATGESLMYKRVCEVVYTITTKCMHHAERADSRAADKRTNMHSEKLVVNKKIIHII